MSLLLIRPECDIWRPGEHTGTFRGNNLAFVTACEALTYWEDNVFSDSIVEKADQALSLLNSIVKRYPEAQGWVRGRGLIQGLGFEVNGLAEQVSRTAFEHGLLIETCGVQDEVLKLLPPLTIGRQELEDGISRLAESIEATLNEIGFKEAGQSALAYH